MTLSPYSLSLSLYIYFIPGSLSVCLYLLGFVFSSFSLYPPHHAPVFFFDSLSSYMRVFFCGGSCGVYCYACVYLYVSLSLHVFTPFLCLCFSLPNALCLSVPFGCLSFHLALFPCAQAHISLFLSATPLPGWPTSLAFCSCEWLRAGAPKATPRGARWDLGTTERGWATPAHHHCCCFCPAGCLYRGGSPLWAKTTPGPCHSPRRATSPKAGRRHLPHPLASAGPPGCSWRHLAGTSCPWLLPCARWA